MALAPPATSFLLTILLCTVVFAGCLSDRPSEDDTQNQVAPFVDPMAYAEGHDHGAYAQHDLRWNMVELGWSDIVPGAALAWGEVDIFGTRAVVAHAWPSAGIAVLDISDPANPQLLDHLDLGYGYGADAKWTPDGNHVALAIQTHSQRPIPSPLLDPIAATAEAGIALLHVDAGGQIAEESWVPAPIGGIHMIATARIGQVDHVFAVHNDYGVAIWEMVSLDTHRLLPVTEYSHIEGRVASADLGGPHDVTIIHDELLDRPLMYIADAFAGLVVADISDPRQPEFLGGWQDDGELWYMHTVRAEVLDDGTRRIVLAPEVYSDAQAEVVAPLWVLDGTDLANIHLQITWKNPGDHGAEQLRYSVHNFQLVDGRIFLAHYHGGVWVLDVTMGDDGRTAVTASGYALPAHDPGHAMSGIYHSVYNMEDAPTVWDVSLKDGVIWATDVNSGLYAFAHPDVAIGDQDQTSTG